MTRKRSGGLFDEETRLWQQHQKRDLAFHEDYKKWREDWKKRGPVEFAYQILKFDPNTGKPLILSDGQAEFLNDIAFNGVRLAIIAAGRGSGKTFVLAIYIMWRIFTHEKYHIACMGGSQEQSDKIAFYIGGWIRNNNILTNYTMKKILKEVITYSEGSATFHACSTTSVRGPHTHDLIIDEQAAGEEKKEGQRSIQAAIWDVSTSPDIHIIQSSTAHYIHGDFLRTWNDAEKLGYKKYNWSIAKHISGEKDPYKTFQDANIKHWKSNVPWIPDLNIEILRNKRGNDKWLVEALGGISMTSGLVFNPADLGACICDREECDTCESYKDGVCPLLQFIANSEGLREEEIPLKSSDALKRFVHERVLGIDWGRGSPCAYVVLGRFRDWVFVLEARELTGLTDQEKVQTAVELIIKWEVEIVRPDPREWVLNGMLDTAWIEQMRQLGKPSVEVPFSVHELFSFEGGQEKYQYVGSLKKYVERHRMIIPKEQSFEDLIRSLRNLSYDDAGKIRKQDDHSSDACMYGISYYDEVEGSSPVYELKEYERGLKSLW
jgi:hypothetical protein